PPPGFSGPSQTPITPAPVLQGVRAATAIPGGNTGPNRAQEARAADAAVMPPPPPQNLAAVQPGGTGEQQGGAAVQRGAPTRAAVQVPDQPVVMTRQEMQQMVAEAAAQAVQQVTNSLSRATTAPNTIVGSRQNAEEDESSYGGGGPTHDREIERMAEQLRQLQAKVDGRAERRARGHPFSADILAAPLPNNYKDTNLVFDGTSDPSRHVRTFENMAVLHGYTDPVSCRAFLSTLRGGALDWFQQLPPGSIVDFEDFAEKLTNQYSSAVAQEKTYLTLMAMRQGEKESLRKYVARYNQACLEIPSAVDEVKAGGLIRSLRAGPCRTSVAKTPAHTYDEVLRRCKKYINLEETEAEFAKLEDLGRGEPRKEKA
ncbi:Unknown protein, partial [Striga hermonthica]